MAKRSDHWNNQKGETLLNVIVAVALGGTLMMFIIAASKNMFFADSEETARNTAAAELRGGLEHLRKNWGLKYRGTKTINSAERPAVGLADDGGADDPWQLFFRFRLETTGVEMQELQYQSECMALPAGYPDLPELRSVPGGICDGLTGPTCASGVLRVALTLRTFDDSANRIPVNTQTIYYPRVLGHSSPGNSVRRADPLAAAFCVRDEDPGTYNYYITSDSIRVEMAMAFRKATGHIVWIKDRLILGFNQMHGVEFVREF